jgi:hypothetical protein
MASKDQGYSVRASHGTAWGFSGIASELVLGRSGVHDG